MSDLRDLYQEVILDHNKKPRNFRKIDEPTCSCDGYNPLCGDKVKVYVKLAGDSIEDVSFEGQGCAISTASASMMTEALKGHTVKEADALFHRFHDMVMIEDYDALSGEPDLGKLAAFAGVKEFPMRVKCATLAWHTLRAALDHETKPVSTE